MREKAMALATSTAPPPLTVEILRRHSRDGSFQEGEALWRRGAVTQRQPDVNTTTWRIQASVREEGAPLRSACLEWDGGRLGGLCSCPDERGALCRHLVAAGLSLVADTPALYERFALRPPWWEVLAPLVGSSELPAEGEAMAYYLDVEVGPPAVLSLRIERMRFGRGGASRGRPVELDTLTGPLPFMSAADRALMDLLLPLQLMGYRNRWFRAGVIRLPPGLTGAVLSQLASCPLVFMKDAATRVTVSRHPARFVLRTRRALEGHVELRGELAPPPAHRGPWPAPTLLVGQSPVWALVDSTFYLVQGLEQAGVYEQTAIAPLRVERSEVPRFAREMLPHLLEQPCFVPEDAGQSFMPRRVQGQVPSPILHLWEEAGSLIGEVSFDYGLGSEPVHAREAREVVDGIDGAEPVWIERDAALEEELGRELLSHGMEYQSTGRYCATGDEALSFLLGGAPVLTPRWRLLGQDRLRQHRLHAAAPSVQASVAARGKWFELDLTMTFGEKAIPVTRVLECLSVGRRFVDLGDGEHAVLPERWLRRHQGLLAALYAQPKGDKLRLPARQVVNLDLLLEGVDRCELDPTVRALLDRLYDQAALPLITQPEGLRATLRPYQIAGMSWLAFLRANNLSGILADDMGLGKTLQSLAWLLHERQSGSDRPHLVVAPTSVVHGWVSEAARFTPSLKVLLYHGPPPQRAALKEQIARVDLVVTSYAVLRREAEFFAEREWGCVILDEAQHIKNPASRGASAARALKAHQRLALTGTPIENNVTELWSIFTFVMPGLLGGFRDFRARYVAPAEDAEQRTEELRRRVRPFILRRLKQTVAQDLPPRTEVTVECDLLPDQRDLYHSVLRASRARVMEAVEQRGLQRSQMTVLDALLRLRQVCCHPSLLQIPEAAQMASSKLERLREMIQTLIEEGHRVLIFSQFVKMLSVLRDELTTMGVKVSWLDGRTRDRAARVDEFNADASIPVFLISLKAGGSGLNLTGADYVIHYDPWWNPAVEDQATDRAHRIGQTRPVIAYRLITRGTVEEKILALQQRKRLVAEGVLQSVAAASAQLTREDLDYLFEVDGEASPADDLAPEGDEP